MSAVARKPCSVIVSLLDDPNFPVPNVTTKRNCFLLSNEGIFFRRQINQRPTVPQPFIAGVVAALRVNENQIANKAGVLTANQRDRIAADEADMSLIGRRVRLGSKPAASKSYAVDQCRVLTFELE